MMTTTEQILWSAFGLCGATLIGTALGFAVKRISHRGQDTVMGYCAGVMMAAAVIGLILPAVDEAGRSGWWVVALGVAAGAGLLSIMDRLTPHLHRLTGHDPELHDHNATLNRVMLFVMAIALHKLPEGMAAGVALHSEEGNEAWMVTLGVAIQNVPEGMVVISPLLLAGVSRGRTLLISLAVAMLEVVGVCIGYGVGSLAVWALPFMLSAAGGAILYVVSDEMIPETHAHGYQKVATYALLAGFMTMVFIESFLS